MTIVQLIWSPAFLSHESCMLMVTDYIIIFDVIALRKPGATKVPHFTFKNIISLTVAVWDVKNQCSTVKLILSQSQNHATHKTDKASPGKARVVPAGENIQNVFEIVFYRSIGQVST